jgi:hypothetical protein
MNTNVVTAKQTDAPFGIDRVPGCRDFGIPRQFEHHAPTSRPPARKAALQDFLVRSECSQRPAIRLISFGFFWIHRIGKSQFVYQIVSQISEDRPHKGRRKLGNLSGRSDTALSGAGEDIGDTLDRRRRGHGATSSRKRWINRLDPGQP